MKNDITIKNSSRDVYDYCKKNGISLEKIEENEFVAVPGSHEQGYFFAQETIDFLKFCRENDSNHKYDILLDGDITVRSLHSFDIWMPIIFIGQNVLLPFAINMVSNYIVEKMKGRETEEAEVDMTFIVKNGKKEKSIHYKGDAKTFKESFEKIDLNKMWEE
ncbi:hypothetical protein [Anaerostipes hadrus]|uniref:hypothetical protein n=1 Tax=Anaerostipes hadrus TaxID=649756 RepID=UPI001C00D181|nr:hypothetical protein [Anaerostipes hadrus]MBT9939662.1 hypothetical protein [Anaerostipes hadrus]